ncbi:hypothetical protein I315_04447 [Cryptococcus gattii Ru294]|uniref:IMS import disulfide relay-system CHCH-CHCH-like Cx9C domain-containing protein n=2 Tax=Cryptococcus gattii TaxID=37769 RepID=E6RFX3_CRYGW|nr:Hypothetical protein CGB_N1130W [Cryptococcus gattii WM276]KIR52989.1 hypothetical protein I315_04447 [Cryptococcus gattii Ru294]KIR78148.1 hypothetical protein I306_04841 [Cryptococcus gattii EJB2]KIY32715.1 hypothetical protein I305_04873 [Cryptococcus gattii E566]KJE01892.1 hypothetical protein I311_04531 [Cryptococcus gattii NT-10]ADV25683.1 Hypothetical protein CGB_N1130W [Cryptococcus gattii WM276]
MDLSYNVVAANCATQMAKYQECVLKNQAGDWNQICRPEGRALAACADASVPHLAELKASCAEQIATYRQCLEKHASQPDEVISENCGGLMKTLWECTEKTVASIEKREAGEKKSV